MAITIMDIAWESLRPIRRALATTRPDAEALTFGELVRAADARRNEGIGTPITDIGAVSGRRFDFRV